MKHTVAFLALALFASFPAFAQVSRVIAVKAVSVHLLLSPSGVLTEDVLALADFASWNFRPVSNSLPTDQRFNEFLVKVRLNSGSETFRKGKVGEIEVRGKRTKQLVASAQLRNIYFGPDGEAVTALLVRDHVCEPLIVTVKANKSQVVSELPFACGE